MAPWTATHSLARRGRRGAGAVARAVLAVLDAVWGMVLNCRILNAFAAGRNHGAKVVTGLLERSASPRGRECDGIERGI